MADRISSLRVNIFCDSADKGDIVEFARQPWIKGFTTDPALMRKAGVTDYEEFGRSLSRLIPEKAFSFPVLSNDFTEMERQAWRIACWGGNVYVKIPITDAYGQSAAPLLERLGRQGIKVNVTALMTLQQVETALSSLKDGPPSLISICAGRIADAGVDPLPIMRGALARMYDHPQIELIWASPREVFNIVQADAIGCQIITVSPDLLKKLPLLGKDLTKYSLETVKMFVDEARAAGFKLAPQESPRSAELIPAE